MWRWTRDETLSGTVLQSRLTTTNGKRRLGIRQKQIARHPTAHHAGNSIKHKGETGTVGGGTISGTKSDRERSGGAYPCRRHPLGCADASATAPFAMRLASGRKARRRRKRRRPKSQMLEGKKASVTGPCRSSSPQPRQTDLDPHSHDERKGVRERKRGNNTGGKGGGCTSAGRSGAGVSIQVKPSKAACAPGAIRSRVSAVSTLKRTLSAPDPLVRVRDAGVANRIKVVQIDQLGG